MSARQFRIFYPCPVSDFVYYLTGWNNLRFGIYAVLKPITSRRCRNVQSQKHDANDADRDAVGRAVRVHRRRRGPCPIPQAGSVCSCVALFEPICTGSSRRTAPPGGAPRRAAPCHPALRASLDSTSHAASKPVEFVPADVPCPRAALGKDAAHRAHAPVVFQRAAGAIHQSLAYRIAAGDNPILDPARDQAFFDADAALDGFPPVRRAALVLHAVAKDRAECQAGDTTYALDLAVGDAVRRQPCPPQHWKRGFTRSPILRL